MQILGYEVNPNAQLSDTLIERLEAMETELIEADQISELVVEYASGQPKQRADEFAESKILRIYDFSTAASRSGDTQIRDYMHFQNDEQEGFSPNGARVWSIYLSPQYTVRMLDDDLPVMLNTQHPSYQVYSRFGNYDYGTLWFAAHMRSFGVMPEGITDTDGDQYFHLLFRRWVDKALNEQVLQEFQETRLEETRKQFLQLAETATNTRVQSALQRLETTRSSISQLEQQLNELSVSERDQQAHLHTAEELKETDAGTLTRNFNELLENVKIDKMVYDSEHHRLKIVTKELYIYSPDRTERAILGQMEIRFEPTARSISIVNVTNAKNGRHHPHIPVTERPCWGVLAAAMRVMVRDFELVPLVSLVIDYLESYNPADPDGRYISYWHLPSVVEVLQEDGSYKLRREVVEATSTESIIG